MGKQKPKEAPPAPRRSALWPALAWAALLAALAFVPDQKGYRWKLLALELGVGTILAGTLLEAAASRESSWTSAPLDWPVAVYGASGLAFYLLSPERQNSEAELARILFSCASYFAATQVFSRVRSPRKLLLFWSAAAAAAGAWAVLQRSGPIGPLSLPHLERPFGTFGNPIFLGTFLASSLLLTAGLCAAPEEGGSLGLLLVFGILQAAGLWVAQSRAGFGGLLAGALAWILLRQAGGRRWIRLAVVFTGAAALAVHFETREWTHGLIWKDTLKLWLAHPWLGCGLGRFHIEFPAYASDQLKALWPQQKMIVNFAHNEYLQVLAETGVAGLAAFLAIPILFFVRLARGSAEKTPALSEAPALAALGLFAANVFSPDLRFGVSAFVAFAALGMSEALSSAVPRPWPPYPARLAPLGIGAALLCGWLFLAARPVLAQRRLAALPDFHIHVTPETQEDLNRLEGELAGDPNNSDLAERLGYLYARERAWAPAIARYELASRLSPARPGPYNNLGNIHYSLGQADDAIRYWELSLAARPDQLDAHLNLGKVYYEKGKLKESAHHLHEALKLDPANAKARMLLKRMVE